MTAKTNAERQSDYRWRRSRANGGRGDRRLNTWITTEAHLALDRLARHSGTTHREMLEHVLLQADAAIRTKFTTDSPEWDAYFNVTQASEAGRATSTTDE